MSISIGIYDFFSYTIPGVIYLFLFWETYRLSTGISLPVDFGSLGQMILAAGLAYLAGILISPIPRLFWHLVFFRKKLVADVALDRIKALYPALDFNFTGGQWPVIFAHIRRDNLPLAENIDKSYAMTVMLRNISFGLLWFAVLQTILLFSTGDVVLHGCIVLLSILFLVTSVRFGFKFANQFYWKIFEYAISTQLQIGEWVKVRPVDRDPKAVGKKIKPKEG